MRISIVYRIFDNNGLQHKTPNLPHYNQILDLKIKLFSLVPNTYRFFEDAVLKMLLLPY